uniref:Uncharacterized protein n=1 Tax=Cucumis melo TaxID=3656 RepID=A0A9I9E2P1_CUCME
AGAARLSSRRGSAQRRSCTRAARLGAGVARVRLGLIGWTRRGCTRRELGTDAGSVSGSGERAWSGSGFGFNGRRRARRWLLDFSL